MARISLLAATAMIACGTAAASAQTVPHYDHIFVIIFENQEYSQIIGSKYAPHLNAIASTYGSATSYFGATHPSEPNYVAMIGGSYHGINDDDFYTDWLIKGNNLAAQITAAGLSWKGYFEDMPYSGYVGTCAPLATCSKGSRENPSYDLYGSKHNGFINFLTVLLDKEERRKMVPIKQLAADLGANTVPNFSVIVPNQCNDMHGGASACQNTVNAALIFEGDLVASEYVSQIMSAPVWKQGNNAIVITFDEGNSNLGCCDANPGGGHIYTTVITNNGPRGFQDPTPYNHYSLTATVEAAFGLPCVEFTCDTANVKPMAPLFAIAQ